MRRSDPWTGYDTWLGEPYQRACAEADVPGPDANDANERLEAEAAAKDKLLEYEDVPY